ncbi:channel protein TolC [Verminephrobacter aporrectodeae subsp. tuberculatae]|uniref:TolC family outer membrane protein n=1 Tax=Verminephrobacter aporrectodeae TaxID=1110389 RepID=UPI002244B34D|nr:TolC family outer membrane protein [Verminephrobacter aporrectodeae]MCW8163917.1 channel protein TolC [Verminephrobacter aporrectodeae subsp. tuberculatae]MCW8168151.1 channel protein TolC [Verminephrobacter aporrectodeae subsp. tuberculatae]
MTLPRTPVLALALLAAALCAPARAQSLLQLLESARAYDTAWQSARAQFDAALHRAEQARAGLLPSATLSSGANRVDAALSRPLVDNTGTTQTLGLSASQPLYRPANRITLEQGQRGVDMAQAQWDAAVQDLLLRVSQAYFDVLAAQDSLGFVQAQKTAVSEQLAFAKRNFDIGATSITDSREAQARYDLVVAQEIAADNDLRVKRLALDQLVGSSGARPQPLAWPVQLPGVQPDDVSAWVDSARAQQPAVRQAASALESARLETRKAQTGHLPTLDLQAGYTITRNPNGTISAPGVNSRLRNASLGVALNLPLFSGFAVQNRIKETLALEEKATTDLETARRSAAQAARAAFFGVQSGRAQIQALEAAEASSQSALDANKLGYQVGVRINIDVLNAQSQFFQTQRDLAQARYNLLLGTLKLRQAAGTLSQQDIEAVDALLLRP